MRIIDNIKFFFHKIYYFIVFRFGLLLSLLDYEDILIMYCKDNLINEVKLIINKVSNLNHQDKKGQTALHYACHNKNFEIVELLIKNGANLNLKNNIGETVLIYSVKHYNEILEFLIKNGSDLNLRDSNGSTALFHACNLHNLESLNLLIHNGANLNLKNHGKTIIEHCFTYHFFKEFEFLIQNIDIATIKNFIVKNIVICGELKDYIIFLDCIIKYRKDFDINCKNQKGNTLLHIACRFNNSKTVELLLQSGANINIKNKKGETPLMFCCRYLSNESFKILIEYGADIEIENNKNMIASDYLIRDKEIYGYFNIGSFCRAKSARK